MKKLLLLLIVLSTVSCGVTYAPVDIQPVKKSFKVEGSKNELYVKARVWMAETFANSLSVEQFSDKEAGIIVGKYLLQPIYASSGYTAYQSDGIYAMIILQMKENTAKITVKADNFMVAEASQATRDNIYQNENLGYTKEEAIAQMNILIASYENYLKTENLEF
jgi:hypothetical protein